jgi:RNA polymerase sigma-70 factor (ECF subfamily)
VTEETAIGGNRPGFQPTLWTLVLRAKDPASPERRQALDLLIQAYWKPVYFFIRRKGRDIEAAKDLTQSFFTAFLEKDFLRNVSRDKGRFRSFVLASLTYFLSDEYDRANAKKRGGGFHFVEAEEELESAEASPEEAFSRKWALEVMAQAVDRLKREYPPEDMALLAGEKLPELGVSDRKNRLHRIRGRLRELLREIIRPSVELESDVDPEIRALLSGSL